MTILNLNVDNAIATITIESPPANALSTTLLKELSEKLDQIEKDSVAKVVVLKGDGRFFSAGADIKEFTDLQDASDYESLAKYGQDLFTRMERFSIPIIAAIHGAALGGGLELAMACHIRIVTKEAKLGLPELNLGIIPGFAGTQRLPQYVGTAKAYELILTGEPISGEDAAYYGLANQAVDEDDLEDYVGKLAFKIASKSKPTIKSILSLVPEAKFSSFEKGVEQERKHFAKVFGNSDAKEGIVAFIEKRKPKFKDN